MFHHSLRAGGGAPRAAHAALWAVLDDLGLCGVAHSMIGGAFTRGLSGGERRRVSIAIELLTTPSLLFLDEPTTGLDATNAAQVVDILARVSAAGVNVVMSIHQPRPDILRLIQRLLLLSPHGTLVYGGPVCDVRDHLERLRVHVPASTPNVADFLLDAVIATAEDGGTRLADLVDGYAASALRRDEAAFAQALRADPTAAAPLRLKTAAPFWRQLRVLSASLLRNTYRHPFLLATTYTSALVAAVALGIAFWDSGYETHVRAPHVLRRIHCCPPCNAAPSLATSRPRLH